MPGGDADIEMGDVGIHDPVFDIGASRANSVPFPNRDSAIKVSYAEIRPSSFVALTIHGQAPSTQNDGMWSGAFLQTR